MLKRLSFNVFTLVLMCTFARADVRDAVVKIGGCSGVCVDPSGLVLTAKHCDHPETVTVEFPGRTVSAQRVYEAPETEGPVVFDCEGDGYPFAAVADQVPPAGSPVWSLGYPNEGGVRTLRRADGVLLSGGQFRFRGGLFQANVVSFRTVGGWSGGPLFDADGQVVGLLNSGDCLMSVFISFAATRRAFDVARNGVQTTTPDRQTLHVFGSGSCGPCQQFKSDFVEDPAFRNALDARFDVVFIDVDRQPEIARRYGVTQVPTFIASGMDPIVGYVGPAELLAALGIDVDAVSIATPTVEEPTTAEPDRGEPEQPADVQPAGPEPTETPVAVGPDPPADNDRLDRALSAVETAASIATWLGVTGATGGTGGLILGGIALWRTLRRKRRLSARDPPAPVPPPVVTVDSPPPPQAIVPETRFAPYERDTFAEAFAWAQAEMARKYPGAVGTLESLQGLMDQYLSAKGIKPAK